ncbi:MAG: transketolase C-terminal domain-containing protein [Acidimicrobiia bacterium]|nr:transketolase C-terminal domain-containing protein [Acidimicrobiia bacterium]
MLTMRNTFSHVTNELLDTDPRVAVVLADIGAGAFAPSDRVINLGIREQALIGTTAGLALSGLRPIAHSYAPFLVERPFEQIKLDLGHQDLGAILVSTGASFDAAREGRTHQSPGDVALLATLPGWKIQVPGHPDEVESMLRVAATGEERVYIRLSAETNAHPHPVDGQLREIRTGSARGATVIAVGPMLDRVLEATAAMDVAVLYASTVRPFDGRTLRQSIGGPEVVLVEPYLEGTSAAEVMRYLGDIPTRLLAIGVPNTEHRHYGTRHHHAAAHGLDAPGLRARIGEFLS